MKGHVGMMHIALYLNWVTSANYNKWHPGNIGIILLPAIVQFTQKPFISKLAVILKIQVALTHRMLTGIVVRVFFFFFFFNT